MKKVAGLIIFLFIFMTAYAFADENNGIKYMTKEEFKKFSEDFDLSEIYYEGEPNEDEEEAVDLFGADPHFTPWGIWKDKNGIITESSYFMIILSGEYNKFGKPEHKIMVVPNVIEINKTIRGESNFLERMVYYIHDGQLRFYQLDDSRERLGYFKQSYTMLEIFESRRAAKQQ